MSLAHDNERPSTLDSKFIGALQALPLEDKLRLGAFRLFSRFLAVPPEASFFEALRGSGVVRELSALARGAGSEAAAPLGALDDWLATADPEDFEAARRDYLEAFVSTRHLPAPPWESVYRSPDRLVFQEPAREVFKAYLEAGLGFDGMKEMPADHISLELAFAAALLVEAPTSADARSQLDRFECEHMTSWMPSFCRDLAGVAKTPPYVAVATALPHLLAELARVTGTRGTAEGSA